MNTTTDWLDEIRWNGDGLIPAIAQDAATEAEIESAIASYGAVKTVLHLLGFEAPPGYASSLLSA